MRSSSRSAADGSVLQSGVRQYFTYATAMHHRLAASMTCCASEDRVQADVRQTCAAPADTLHVLYRPSTIGTP